MYRSQYKQLENTSGVSANRDAVNITLVATHAHHINTSYKLYKGEKSLFLAQSYL